MIISTIALIGCTCSAICFAKWQRTKHMLIVTQQLLQTTEQTTDFLFYCELSPKQQYKYLSKGFYTFFGEECAKRHIEAPIETYLQCIHPDDLPIVMCKLDGTADYSKPFLIRIRTQQGTYRWFEEYATPTFHKGQVVALKGIYRDVHERILLQKRLEHKVMHDPLTSAKNRTFFEEQLSELNGEPQQSCGIIICDLDDLKTINDTKGHKSGDQYIQQSAHLLLKVIGTHGHVCRIGGDEFAIVCKNLTREQLQQYIQQIESAIMIHNEQTSQHISMSMGYSYTTCSYGIVEDVFKQADEAMYVQKAKRKQKV